MISSKKYPPKNRDLVEPSLAVGMAQLHDAAGWRDITLNELGLQAAQELLSFGDSVVSSVLSGEPGYYYRDAEICLALTPNELARMLNSNLDPDEYLRLRETFGLFRYIDTSSYDNTTGRALAPLLTTSERDSFVAQCLDGRIEPTAIDNFVERWHEGPPTNMPLHRFLGMRRDEYARWLKDSRAIYEILFYRLRRRSSMPPTHG